MSPRGVRDSGAAARFSSSTDDVMDDINGLPVVSLDMPRPANSNGDIAIYRL